MAARKTFIILIILLLLASVFAFANKASDSAEAVIYENFPNQYNNNTVFEIDDLEDWKRISKYIEAYDFLDKTIILNCDLDLKLYPGYLLNFRGTFEGNHHKVFNITQPFFNEIKTQGIVRNLYFYNANIEYHQSIVATNNMGTIENVSAHGEIRFAQASGLVYSNGGTIKDSVSFLNIVDTSTFSKSYISGLVGSNAGQIIGCHFMGSISGTNNSVIGGLTSHNVGGSIKSSSARFDLKININKPTNNLEAGGISGRNGYSSDYQGEISNSFTVVDVEYLTAEPIPSNLAISGLVGNSINTNMQNCYSDIKGQGNLYGIISQSYAQPVYQDPETEEEIVDYILFGTEGIENCFSVVDLQPEIFWYINQEDIVEDTLPVSNQLITYNNLLNKEAPALLDLLQNPEVDWLGQFGQYPTIADSIYEGEGTIAEPFVIDSVNHILALRAFMYDEELDFYFEQRADLDFHGINFETLDFYEFSSHYNGNDFALMNIKASAFMHQNSGSIQGLGFIGGNEDIVVATNNFGSITNTYTPNTIYGTTHSYQNIYMGRDFALSETFGLTSGQSFSITSRDNNFSQGDGSQQDPYIIQSVNQLASIASLTENDYVALGNDIQVNNSQWMQKYYLNIGGFSANLDGRGHSIIGVLNEPLIRATFSGKIKNLRIRGINTAFDNAGLLAGIASSESEAENIEVYGSLSRPLNGGLVGINEGQLSYIRNYATLSHETSGGIAAVNDGVISKSVNYGYSYFAITQNTASAGIENCLNKGQSQSLFSGGYCLSSINYNGGMIELWHDEEKIAQNSNIDIHLLKEYSQFDLAIWGYYIGENYNPTIKFVDRFYKKDIGHSFFNDNLNYNRVYNPKTITSVSTVEYDLIKENDIRNSVSYIWFFNGQPFEQLQIVNAGQYKVEAFYEGDDNIFSYQYELTITISKATLPSPDFWGQNGIEGVHRPYIYDGEPYDIYQVKAFNLDSIILAEHYEYNVIKDGLPVEEIIHTGVYDLELTINNPNYTPYNASAQITIIKAELTIEMQSYDIDYLEDPPNYAYSIDLQTREGVDEAMILTAYNNAYSAITEAEGVAVCDYTQGSDSGDYVISFVVELDNYIVAINEGILTVNLINLPAEDIDFSNQQKVYTGYVIELTANITDEDIEAEYQNNDNKDVGEYTINAIFSKANYLPLELEAELTITKAILSVMPEDKEIVYDEDTPQFNLDEQNIEFLGEDDISSLMGEAFFSTNYIKGNSVGEYYISVSNLTSLNYEIVFESGVLTVSKAYMTNLFQFNDRAYIYDGQQKTITLEVFGYDPTILYTHKLNEQILASPPTDSGIYEVVAFAYAISENYLNTAFYATLSIIKAEIDANFLAEYTIIYDGENHLIDYEGTPQNAEEWDSIQQYGQKGGDTYYSFKESGTYSVTMVFEGHKNYNDKEITTSLTIESREISVEIEGAKVFSAQPQLPDYSFNEEIYPEDEIEVQWMFSLYGYGYGDAVMSVVNAGTYTTYPQSQNPNYEIVNTPQFVIQRLTVSFTPVYVEFEYGNYMDFVYIHQGMPISYTSGRDYIIRKNFYIEKTNQSVNIRYSFAGPDAGTYDVDEAQSHSNYIFEIPQNAEMSKVRVRPRELDYTWNETYVTVQYDGQEKQPFEIEISNKVSSDFVTVTLKADGNLKDAGVYTVWAELVEENNYLLNAPQVYLEITPAPLTVKADNKSVARGTLYANYSATITGLMPGETLASMGISLIFNCAYSISSPVGISLPISITSFELNNYDITFVQGVLTVTANEYPLMSLASRTYVYDGQTKALEVGGPYPEGWQPSWASYLNNYKTDVGVYNVTATINFPNATQQRLNATLTITKATPQLELEALVIPYSVVAFLSNNDIIGIARINGDEVSGTLLWAGQTELRRGENQYPILFTPDDTHNINEVSSSVTVTGKSVREEALNFDNTDVIIADEDLYLTKETTITLSDTYDGLELYHNGIPAQSINLTESGEHEIVLRHKGNIVYSKTFNVIMSGEDDEDESFPQGESIFSISGGYFDGEGRIFVEDECHITINDDYPEAKLFLNGTEVSFVVLYGEEERAKLQVTYNSMLIYSRTYVVVEVVQPEPEPPTEPIKNWLWLIVLGGIAGGGGLGVLAFFSFRKLIRSRKKEYNPYEAVEKKKNKYKF